VNEADKGSYLYARWLYLRILGAGFLTSFLSLATQLNGLIGPRGILPAQEYLQAVARAVPGWQRFVFAPTLLWLNANAPGLALLCLIGGIAGLLLLLNLAPRASVVVAGLCYLSVISVARNFSGFQSDGLMLESAFLAAFLAPSGFRPKLAADQPVSRIVRYLLWWFCFRLMLESGTAKLLSGDPTWRNFTALNDYYVNCPFPTWIGWFVQHLPPLFHESAVAFTFVVELIAPFLIVCGRRARLVAGLLWIAMHTGILLTANYTFLNYNSIALGILLFDDAFLRRLFRRPAIPVPPPTSWDWKRAWRFVLPAIVLGWQFYVATFLFLGSIQAPVQGLPPAFWQPVIAADPFRIANRYALFASMTHERLEIEYEGSNDGGRTWRVYPFKWQPQALDAHPRFMAPHLPRFDWNLWFAGLSNYQEYPLVLYAGARLIEGEPSVIGLFAGNPFPDKPPEMVRFPSYQYHFTDLRTLFHEGRWWSREFVGYYAPIVFRDPADGQIRLMPDAMADERGLLKR
jgi:uncharacterized membrane protein YphA (DoxX/SURF4 family)